MGKVQEKGGGLRTISSFKNSLPQPRDNLLKKDRRGSTISGMAWQTSSRTAEEGARVEDEDNDRGKTADYGKRMTSSIRCTLNSISW